VLLACRAISDGGVLTALARLAFDARAAGRHLGAEMDFGNPLCEAGGFLCEVSDDSEVDVSGVMRIGTTTDTPVLNVNGTKFDVGELFEIWSKPLMEVYP